MLKGEALSSGAEEVAEPDAAEDDRKPAAIDGSQSSRKVGFASMAQTISGKWKAIDPETSAKYDVLAREEMERYKRKKEKFQKKQIARMEENRARLDSTVHEATRADYLAQFEGSASLRKKKRKRRQNESSKDP